MGTDEKKSNAHLVLCKEKIVRGLLLLRHALVAFNQRSQAEHDAALTEALMLPALCHYPVGVVLFTATVLIFGDEPWDKNDPWLILAFGISGALISRFICLPLLPQPYAWLRRFLSGSAPHA
jgi:hypothetical protein